MRGCPGRASGGPAATQGERVGVRLDGLPYIGVLPGPRHQSPEEQQVHGVRRNQEPVAATAAQEQTALGPLRQPRLQQPP
ncbi:hypothetical protein [Streptomyces sp. NPDC057253]|uniref:hypothetical protein n=1 Tax=Streptomyces sp. NPDC057253 TaxID=3346069 RepID=UPI00363EE96E